MSESAEQTRVRWLRIAERKRDEYLARAEAAESEVSSLRAALEAVKIWAEDKTGVDNEHPLSIGYRRAQGDAVDRIDRTLSEQDSGQWTCYRCGAIVPASEALKHDSQECPGSRPE